MSDSLEQLVLQKIFPIVFHVVMDLVTLALASRLAASEIDSGPPALRSVSIGAGIFTLDQLCHLRAIMNLLVWKLSSTNENQLDCNGDFELTWTSP